MSLVAASGQRAQLESPPRKCLLSEFVLQAGSYFPVV